MRVDGTTSFSFKNPRSAHLRSSGWRMLGSSAGSTEAGTSPVTQLLRLHVVDLNVSRARKGFKAARIRVFGDHFGNGELSLSKVDCTLARPHVDGTQLGRGIEDRPILKGRSRSAEIALPVQGHSRTASTHSRRRTPGPQRSSIAGMVPWPSEDRLRWPEKAAMASFLLVALVAVATPTPLLETRSLGIDQRIFSGGGTPSSSRFELPAESERVFVESMPAFGCIRIRVRNDAFIGPVCNEHLSCLSGASVPSRGASFEVFRLAKAGEFYVTTESACHSACCDRRGMSFSANGRLTDGPVHRLWLRLGIAGALALLLGFGSATWIAAKRGGAGIAARLAVVVGLAVATVCLCLSL